MILVLAFSFGISCNKSNDIEAEPLGIDQSNLRASTGVEEVTTGSVSTRLKTLYLENFNDQSRNQLSKLLSDESYKKLVFQNYLLRNGQFTLVAFAVKQNGKDFNPQYQVLGVVNDDLGQDISDKEVFFGDQKLESSNGFQELKSAINEGTKNDSSKNYVIFIPQLKLLQGSRSYVIEYSINYTHTLDDLDVQILPVRSTRLNPSPPY